MSVSRKLTVGKLENKLKPNSVVMYYKIYLLQGILFITGHEMEKQSGHDGF